MVVSGATISRAGWAQAASLDLPLDTTIPEPGMLVLCGVGLALWGWRWDGRRKAGTSRAVCCGVAGARYAGAGVVQAGLLRTTWRRRT